MDQDDTSKIIDLLQSFWGDMNQWEKLTYDSYVNGKGDFELRRNQARDQLLSIYNKYLTQKQRKTGKLAGPDVAAYPEYDSSLENVLNIESSGCGKYVVNTKKRDPNIVDYFTEHRYKIIEKNGKFLIDSKESYSSYKKSWVREAL